MKTDFEENNWSPEIGNAMSSLRDANEADREVLEKVSHRLYGVGLPLAAASTTLSPAAQGAQSASALQASAGAPQALVGVWTKVILASVLSSGITSLAWMSALSKPATRAPGARAASVSRLHEQRPEVLAEPENRRSPEVFAAEREAPANSDRQIPDRQIVAGPINGVASAERVVPPTEDFALADLLPPEQPELPAVPSTESQEDSSSVREEAMLLRRIRSDESNVEETRVRLDDYFARFPSGLLEPEALYLRARNELRLGHRERAAQLQRLLESRPDGVGYAAQLRTQITTQTESATQSGLGE